MIRIDIRHHWPTIMRNNNNDINCCRVCGLDQSFPIWGTTGNDPSFAICPCCGVEFGYEDADRESCISIRQYWIEEKGGEWWNPKEKPKGWSLDKQLKSVPAEYK